MSYGVYDERIIVQIYSAVHWDHHHAVLLGFLNTGVVILF